MTLWSSMPSQSLSLEATVDLRESESGTLVGIVHASYGGQGAGIEDIPSCLPQGFHYESILIPRFDQNHQYLPPLFAIQRYSDYLLAK